jgi:hypothetical protein
MGAATMGTTYARGGSSIVRARNAPDLRLIPITFTMSNSYATGGDTALTLPGGITASKIINKTCFPSVKGVTFYLDTDNSKIIAYATGVSGGAEVANAVDLSALGAVTVYFMYPAGS